MTLALRSSPGELAGFFQHRLGAMSADQADDLVLSFRRHLAQTLEPAARRSREAPSR
ncbi:hypothetical protein GXW82_31345 [Streptacidiphilus sp. 4-A2]|nr:hypothetical protein [Streptacidiphilus sp. 4-A2]